MSTIKPEQVARVLDVLRKIAKHYQTPEQIKKNSEKQYGLGFEETLEMSYENIQNDAKAALIGIKCKHKKTALGYIAAHDDADKRTKKGQKQIFCPVCKLYCWPDEL